MQKAVLLSISPKWCDLIKSGKKTVEIRKTYPNIGQNFKCYIYETLRGNGIGKVIGEFICDRIFPVSCYYSNPDHRSAYREQPCTAMTDRQMIDYLGNGKKGYGWHISNLVIYDEPIDVYAFYSATTGKQLTRPPKNSLQSTTQGRVVVSGLRKIKTILFLLLRVSRLKALNIGFLQMQRLLLLVFLFPS